VILSGSGGVGWLASWLVGYLGFPKTALICSSSSFGQGEFDSAEIFPLTALEMRVVQGHTATIQ